MTDETQTALSPSSLRRTCDPAELGFRSTGELESVDELIGQDRAFSALAFGARIRQDGFNIFALGPARSGRHSAVRFHLEKKAAGEPVPDDWIYVNNFKSPDKPVAIRLPPGMGSRLKSAMAQLIDDLSSAVPSMFESEDYRNRRKSIDDEFETEQESAFEAFRKKAQAENIAVLRTPMGFALAPLSGNQVIKPEVFNALPQAERERIEKVMERLQGELETTLRKVPQLEKQRRQKIRKLNNELAELVVGLEIKDVLAEFEGNTAVGAYLEHVRADMIDNFELFLNPAIEGEERAFGGPARLSPQHPMAARYAVNVVVSHIANGAGAGAPVVFEEHPTLPRMLGRIDHRAMMGALVTDFTLIKPGALHAANGGYLIVDAMRVLTEPMVWDALKRSLRRKRIEITTIADELGFATTESLMPDAIPLDVKVVLVGDRRLYYLLAALDPEFEDLFKVQADFEDDMVRSAEAMREFARLLATMVRREGLLHLSAPAAARLIEEASRDAEDAERLSLRIAVVADLVRESHFWAQEAGAALVDLAHVERAIAEKRRRSERIRDRAFEGITRNILLVDTDGEKIGQVNGLSVMSLGSLSFGRPSRITARVRMGAGKIVDIEREVELGGPIHSKGVLILSSYLASHFALGAPVSLWASLVFEQSYGGIEGDSASSAELYALLSALAEAPVRQSFAVTGSVNQMGEVQAIGGVNEKIEGFFDICKARGLTGRQGVVIPRANTVHLMLRPDIVDAVRDGKFHIHAVSTIDEGISLLTGCTAGSRGAEGSFPAGSINARVEERLTAFAKARQAFGPGGNHEEHRT
jgi:lon-related putative ATP-dependent protease